MSPQIAELEPAGGGAEQPPAGGGAQQDDATELPSSSGSGLEGSSLGVRGSSSSLEDGSSSGAPSIIEDILRLQRRCAAATERQAALGDSLLRRAVLRTSVELPVAPQRQKPDASRRMSQAELKQQWLETQPWYLNWDRRLTQVGVPGGGVSPGHEPCVSRGRAPCAPGGAVASFLPLHPCSRMMPPLAASPRRSHRRCARCASRCLMPAASRGCRSRWPRAHCRACYKLSQVRRVEAGCGCRVSS